jgi:hypothetical protein
MTVMASSEDLAAHHTGDVCAPASIYVLAVSLCLLSFPGAMGAAVDVSELSEQSWSSSLHNYETWRESDPARQ